MAKKKYLPLYQAWMKTGLIEDDTIYSVGMGGLCNTVIGRQALHLFKPQDDHELIHWDCGCYWASPVKDSDHNNSASQLYAFNPIRQNIVLLLAAINGEL